MHIYVCVRTCEYIWKLPRYYAFSNCWITGTLPLLPFQELLDTFWKLARPDLYWSKASVHCHWESVWHQSLSCLSASNCCWQLWGGIACLSTGCWRELTVVQHMIILIAGEFIILVSSSVHCILGCAATCCGWLKSFQQENLLPPFCHIAWTSVTTQQGHAPVQWQYFIFSMIRCCIQVLCKYLDRCWSVLPDSCEK